MNEAPAPEARAFLRYVAGRDVPPRAIALYAAHACRETASHPADLAILRFALERPWALGLLDGGLAWLRPDALLRRRLLLAAAIAETQPELCDAFLPRERPARYLLTVAWTLVRAACESIAGAALLLVVR